MAAVLTLRARFLLYLAVLHLPFAIAAGLVLRGGPRWGVLVVEAVFALSLTVGLLLVRRVFSGLELLRSGAELIAERDFGTRFRDTGQPELDALVRVYNDMAARLREERLKQEEQHAFLSKLLAASPSGVVTLDLDGRVDLVNPAASRFLQAGEEPSGRRLAELPSPLAQALVGIPPGLAQVVPLPGGRRVKASRGEFLDRGFPRDFFLVDELTEELRRSERAAYEKLIRMMAHEVNNSVGAVGSLLSSCLSYSRHLPAEEKGDFESALGVVLSRTGELAAFMKGLAEVVKIPEPRLAPCDVAELLRGLERLLSGELARRRVELAFGRVDALDPVPLDRAQMEQALLNVLKNAVEAAGEGGRVTLHVLGPPSAPAGLLPAGRPPRGAVVVEDSGPGLPAEAASQLFTPFFTTKESGQGLGLTVVKEVLVRHGFGFALETPPGGPSRFLLVL